MSTLHAVVVTASDRPGMMSAVTKVLADHNANIRYVDLHSAGDRADIYFEFTLEEPPDALFADLKSLDGVLALEEIPSFAKIYGKRIIVMGGGAQVGQVALGAIAEADRHNIRGERISVDTIPLVGEQELAAAVRAAARLPRVKLLVLAGSLMGGAISQAVEEVRKNGPLRDLAEHGRQRARRRRPRRQRSDSGRRDGRHGHRRHGQVRSRPTAETPLLRISCFLRVRANVVQHDRLGREILQLDHVVLRAP